MLLVDFVKFILNFIMYKRGWWELEPDIEMNDSVIDKFFNFFLNWNTVEMVEGGDSLQSVNKFYFDLDWSFFEYMKTYYPLKSLNTSPGLRDFFELDSYLGNREWPHNADWVSCLNFDCMFILYYGAWWVAACLVLKYYFGVNIWFFAYF